MLHLHRRTAKKEQCQNEISFTKQHLSLWEMDEIQGIKVLL